MLGYGYGYGSPFYMFWDPTYVLILIGVVLSLIASAMVRRNFARYSVVRSASGLTGAQVAQRILSYAGLLLQTKRNIGIRSLMERHLPKKRC